MSGWSFLIAVSSSETVGGVESLEILRAVASRVPLHQAALVLELPVLGEAARGALDEENLAIRRPRRAGRSRASDRVMTSGPCAGRG